MGPTVGLAMPNAFVLTLALHCIAAREEHRQLSTGLGRAGTERNGPTKGVVAI